MDAQELKEVFSFICSVEFWRMGVLWTLSLIYSYLQLFWQTLFSAKSKTYSPRCSPSSIATRRPICIVTGATSGLGAEAACALSREGYYVVLVGRSLDLLSKIASNIKEQSGDACVKAFQVDLSSFKSIWNFKREFQQWLSDMNMHCSVQRKHPKMQCSRVTVSVSLTAPSSSSGCCNPKSFFSCRLPTHNPLPFRPAPIRWKSSFRNRNSRMKASASASAQPLTNADQLIDSVETFIFDCDGVIWKGDKLISGVPETLDMLRAKGKRLVFVTNNSTKSRKQYGKKFETLGLSVAEEEIFASSFAAAAYLKSIDFPKDKKVYVIGEDGILKELELAGFQYLGGPADGDKKIELKPGFMMEHDEDVGAVVVGFDRYFNYYKVQYGTLCIRENPGCLFIATNRDAVTHLTDAQEWAGGGSMVGALVGSTQREPLVVGKPSTFMMDYLANKFNIQKSQICMVGDRLDTDILFGQNGGCKTLLVLSGVTSLSTLQDPKNKIQPDFYTNKISDFLSLKAATV